MEWACFGGLLFPFAPLIPLIPLIVLHSPYLTLTVPRPSRREQSKGKEQGAKGLGFWVSE